MEKDVEEVGQIVGERGWGPPGKNAAVVANGRDCRGAVGLEALVDAAQKAPG